MRTYLTLLVTFCAVATVSAQSSFTASLDPFQEVPPHNTPAYGSADFTLNGTTLSVDANTGIYTDLLGGANNVVIADGPVGMNGTTVFSLTLDTPGATSGTFEGSGTLTMQQITDLNAGNFYVNIRDTVFPSGELRGQLEAVPEPSTLALAGLGALAFLTLRFRHT
jgi:hypothetical protein